MYGKTDSCSSIFTEYNCARHRARLWRQKEEKGPCSQGAQSLAKGQAIKKYNIMW